MIYGLKCTMIMTNKINEMTFYEFGESIVPTWGCAVVNPKDTPFGRTAWLTSVWARAEIGLRFSISWHVSATQRMLAPEAQTYQFQDSELRAFALELGLDPTQQADMIETAKLLATCKAWLSTVRAHCRDCATAGLPEQLTTAVQEDFVRLSCHWVSHPWIRRRVFQYANKSQLLQQAQAEQLDERPQTSSDPRWPGISIIYGRAPEQTPQELAEALERRNRIGYWINKLDAERTNYSSRYDVVAWDAKDDIDATNQKIEGLMEFVDAQRSLVARLQKIWRKNIKLDASVNGRSNAGRPKQMAERQDLARKFTSQWVQSLMLALAAPSGAALESLVSKSSQRNWQRWLTGHASPTQASLVKLLKSQITHGALQGQRLGEINTTPTCDELLSLIRLTGTTSKA